VRGVLLAAAAGVCIAVQVGLIGRAAGTRSPIAIAMFVQLGGASAALAVLLVRGRVGEMGDVAGLVSTWLPAGVAGTIIVASLASAAAQVGVATALGLSVAVQLGASLAWDLRGGVVAQPAQALAGVVLLSAGAWLLVTART
jgi:uncharacterized membrane protein YdcZ (DUF606 family)